MAAHLYASFGGILRSVHSVGSRSFRYGLHNQAQDYDAYWIHNFRNIITFYITFYIFERSNILGPAWFYKRNFILIICNMTRIKVDFDFVLWPMYLIRPNKSIIQSTPSLWFSDQMIFAKHNLDKLPVSPFLYSLRTISFLKLLKLYKLKKNLISIWY